jgi:phytanoyl-CoA hydroxylase
MRCEFHAMTVSTLDPSPHWLASWAQNGYAVLPDFWPPTTVRSLRERASAWVPRLPEPRTAFSTTERAQIDAASLMDSASAVHGFWEPQALDAQGRLTVPREQALNKIGHALHDLDDAFSAACRGAAVQAVVRALGLQQPLLLQSMLIFKQPRIGAPVVWHQDASFLITEPDTVVGLWWALEDATVDNGCLWVEPGGHRGPLRERYERSASGALVMRALDHTPWPRGSQTIPVEVQAGSLVLLHGRLPHASSANTSGVSRLAFSLHLVSGAATYSPLNWLQREPHLPLRGFTERQGVC